MTTEIQTYPDEQSWKDAMKRGSIRPSTGWIMIANSKDSLSITWNNDPPPPPTAEEIRKEELKDKVKNDTMTHKELIEYLTLIGVINTA